MQVFVLILLSIMFCEVKSYCAQYYQNDPIEGESSSQEYQVNMKNQQTIGMGFWITYRPLGFVNQAGIMNSNIDNPESSDSKELFIFSFQQPGSSLVSFLLYAHISFVDRTIVHTMIIQDDYLTQPLDYDTYEGSWFFIYCYIDQQQINLNHYDLYSQQSFQQVFYGSPLMKEDMVIITGGIKVFQVKTYYMYPGYMQNVIYNHEDFYLSNTQFIQDCTPEEMCYSFDQQILGYNKLFTGNFEKFANTMLKKSYYVQGWIKLMSADYLQTVLFRISRTNDYFSDDSQIGDKILYVTYYLDSENLNDNGFSMQTYSYEYPWKPPIYIPDEKDTRKVRGEKYFDLLTQWHYFQFLKADEPIYKVYYAGTDTIEEYKWEKKINHFTPQRFYFSLGGDDYSKNFNGYLSDWSFKYFCDEIDVSFVPKCHYSCLTCKGITENDCTSCDESNNRLYSEFQHSCQCKYGYLNFQYVASCEKMSEYSGAFEIIEKQIKTKLDLCEFGYFQYNLSCIECPYAVQDTLIRCADCILLPEIFSEKLTCTFEYNSTDKLSVFNYNQLSVQEQELYKVTLTFDQKLKLQKMIGHKNNTQCKDSFFLSENNDCQQCLDNCLECQNYQSCKYCEPGYHYKDGACIECETCSRIDEKSTEEGTISFEYCPEGMYLLDGQCIECGDYCKMCDEQCYYCVDNEKYFITLDKFNCVECQIQNCKYCFQYYESNQFITTSLDLDGKDRAIYSEAKIGCALCRKGYFYSYISQKCETTTMIDCESGVITENQEQKCLISKTRLDAVQSFNCQDQLCVQCINDYSAHQSSFCVICKDGYYSTFKTGQCKQCPKNCQTCAEFNFNRNDLWKSEIRAFYQYFVNKNHNHYFENHQVTWLLNIICLSCSPNFQLNQYKCMQVCDDDCLDCVLYLDADKIHQYKCNQCKPQTFNLQRSVYPNKIQQCFACPDYCSACYERTPEQIRAINPFFNTTSPFLKYTHICYEPELRNQVGEISIMPKYIVPNVCQDSKYCEKVYNIQYYLYCDVFTFMREAYREQNSTLRDRYEEFTLTMIGGAFETLAQEEILTYLNQVRVSEFDYVVDIVYLEGDSLCWFLGDNDLTNSLKQNVFTLENSNITFRNSNKSDSDYLPLVFMTLLKMTNFKKVAFEGLEFRIFDEYFLYIEQPIVNVTFINDHDPVTISFIDCIFIQNFWFKFAQITFVSKFQDKLFIKQLKMETLQIANSSIFNIQPSQTQGFQQIDQLIINNSNFTNSSIFMYNAEGHSLHQTINFTNVKIQNSNFSNSFFINSAFLFDYTIGEIYLENFHIDNVILNNHSVFFQIFSAIKFQVKNLSIYNTIFQDNSSFIACNILNIQDFIISNSIVNYGYLIHIYQQTLIKKYEVLTKELVFKQLNFVNNTYSTKSINSFIYILEDQFVYFNLKCTELVLDNNVLMDSQLGRSSFIYVSYKYSLIYIQCNKCIFQNLKIYRGIGLPEISIIDSKELVIENLHIETRKEFYKRSLHSSVECSKRLIYQDIPFVLYIWSYIKVLMKDSLIQNTMIADYQLIIFQGKSHIESFWEENITITNSTFVNNLLLMISENKQSSLISIETQQVSFIKFENLEFHNNFLNQFNQITLSHSSPSLSINAEQGSILLQSLIFNTNIITNSSDSTLFILGKSLIITNCSFQNQNRLTHEVFQKNIVFHNNYTIQDQDILNNFQILSNGGNGQLETNYFQMSNTVVQNSLAINGGGFYITTLGDGIILVENCTFLNTSTVLNNNQLASGGLFYIDSSLSILNLTIKNCSIQSAYSRTYGGAIYIEPSRSYNLIQIETSIIHSVFSIQHSFLSFSSKKSITIQSNIIINDIMFQNTMKEFENFAMQLQDLQEQNLLLFQTENPFIYAQFCNFSMINCHFDNIHLASLVEILQGIDIKLQHITIFNSTILVQPIIKLSLRPDKKGIILIKHVLISNLIQQFFTELLDCHYIPQSFFDLICPQHTQDMLGFPIITSQQENNQLNCNLNQLYSIIQSQSYGIIELSDMKENHFAYIYDLKIEGVKCDNCLFGVFNVKDFDSFLNLEIVNINIMNNNCGVLGCLSIIKSTNDTNVLQTLQASIDIITPSIAFNTTIKNSVFINNSAQFGGGCYLSQIDILFNNTLFLNNSAAISGGAIYYDSQETTLLVLNSQIIKNKAAIGGGIYLKNQQLQQVENLNLRIEDNLGVSFSNNLYEFPRFLQLSLNETFTFENIELFSNSTTIIEQVDLSPYFKSTEVLQIPSGSSFSSYNYFDPVSNSYKPLHNSLRLYAKNVFDEKITNLGNTECQISANIINTQNPIVFDNFKMQNNMSLISKSSVMFNLSTGDYNLDDLIIFFNPFQDAKNQLQLAFQCNSITLPFYNSTSNQLFNKIANYILLLNVRTFACQLGEYLNQTSGGCVLCDVSQNQYSVTINSSQCSYQDETKISDIESAMIKLRKEYWRAFYYSEIIEVCHNLLSNCEGGWSAGYPSCATGHIGALCEQCDLFNIRGSGEFSQNQYYQCSSCDYKASNILNIIFVIIWTFTSVFITVTSTMQMIDDLVFQLKLKPLGHFIIAKTDSTSTLLKVLTNYLQIVSSIASFQLQIPIGITLAVRGVGNPIGSVAFSLDCYLKFASSVPILYFRVIWGFAMAGMYIFLFFLYHIMTLLIKRNKLNITFVTTTFIYIYIYLSPNSVSDLSFLLSYRNISGQEWIAANVAYLYNTDVHRNWLMFFVAPSFFIIGILLPFFFWYILYYNRYKLDKTKTRKIWGYLYNEYKLSSYYWETIKIMKKELIILILIYYEDYVVIKACLIFFLLHMYSKLTTKLKPYLTENLNQIDSLSTSICKFSIALAQSIYLAQGLDIQEVVWPFYVVLGLLNFYFIFEMISKLLFAYFDKLYEQIDRFRVYIGQYIPQHIRANKFCMRMLRNTTERKFIVRQRYQKIRVFLINQAKFIIDYKKQNNMGLQCFETNYTTRNSNTRLSTLLKTSTNFKLVTEPY